MNYPYAGKSADGKLFIWLQTQEHRSRIAGGGRRINGQRAAQTWDFSCHVVLLSFPEMLN